MGKTIPISIAGPAYEGPAKGLNAQTCVNLCHLVDRAGGKAVLSLMGRPVLKSVLVNLGAAPIRGEISVDGNIYTVQGSNFWEVRPDGQPTLRGTLDTNSGTVELAWNGLQIGMADGTKLYSYTLSSTAFAAVGGGCLGGDSICFIDQFGVTNKLNSGIAQSSGIRDFTSWSGLDVATAEGDPDDLVRVMAIHSDLHLMGISTNEIYNYANVGATGFPFLPRQRDNIGLGARWGAIAADNALYWPGQNGEGFYGIVRSTGGVPAKVSTPAIDYQIGQYSTISDCIGWSFTLEGHTFIGFTFPTGGATWVFDAATGLWAEWRSYGYDSFKAAYHCVLNGEHVMGDTTTGKLYKVGFGAYSDTGDPVIKQRTTQHLTSNGLPLRINKLHIDFEPGVGLVTGQGSDPLCMLEVSRDGGHTFIDMGWRTIGKIGEYSARAEWHQLGQSRNGWTFRITVSDSVQCNIIGAYANIG